MNFPYLRFHLDMPELFMKELAKHKIKFESHENKEKKEW